MVYNIVNHLFVGLCPSSLMFLILFTLKTMDTVQETSGSQLYYSFTIFRLLVLRIMPFFIFEKTCRIGPTLAFLDLKKNVY